MPSCPSTQPSSICWAAALLRCMWVEKLYTTLISHRPPGTVEQFVLSEWWLVTYSNSKMFISVADPSRQGWSSANQGYLEVSGAHRGSGGSHQLVCADSRLRQRLDTKLKNVLCKCTISEHILASSCIYDSFCLNHRWSDYWAQDVCKFCARPQGLHGAVPWQSLRYW